MNYAEIKTFDVANGPGIRVSLFVSGCNHRCPGCFNEIAWDFNYGKPFTQDTIDSIIESLKPDYIQGLTLLGGEPFEYSNQKGLLPLVRQVRKVLPQKDIWCYSGYLLDKDMQPGGAVYTEYTKEMLKQIDVLIDGEFVEAKKDLTLIFRGSSNQRIMCLKDGEFAGMWQK